MLEYLKNEIKEFSEGKFGHREGMDAKGPLNHLKEEVDELLESLGKGGFEEEEEWADCLLLLLDAFRIRYGNEVSYNKLLHFCLTKIEFNKKRDWSAKPDENGVFKSLI